MKSTSRCHTGSMPGLRIGEVASRAGVSTATIRYYERAGLMPKPARSEAGYRLYSKRAVEELTFVRRAQAIGFSLDEIRGLLQVSRGGVAPCARVISLAGTHLTHLEERIQQLQTLRDRLADAVSTWKTGRCGFSSERLCDLLEGVDAPALRELTPAGQQPFQTVFRTVRSVPASTHLRTAAARDSHRSGRSRRAAGLKPI